MKYYAMIDGERRGPYELEQLADAGVRPSTYVWCKGMPDWEKAEDVADVCRMFRNRIYDLMHPASTTSQFLPASQDGQHSQFLPASQDGSQHDNAGTDSSTPTRFDRHLQDPDPSQESTPTRFDRHLQEPDPSQESTPTRFDRHLQEPGLPSLEEIEKRDDAVPPSSLLLPLAIIATVVCFPPTGIAAIVNAIKARKEWQREPGSHTAGSHCRLAKLFIGLSIFLGMILYSFLFRFVW